MKRKFITDLLILLLVFLVNVFKPFAQQPEERKQTNSFAAITIIKLDEVKAKEDMDKVKTTLSQFGYKVHSFKINFERKEVLVRMRQRVPTEDLIAAFKSDGYTAWHDPNQAILQSDAVYRKK